MSKKILRQVSVFLYLLILVIPIYTVLQNTGDLTRFWDPTPEPGEITYFFLRAVGLYAFVLLFLQITIGAWMPHWTKLFPKIFLFHETQGLFAYGFLFAHPLFFLVNSFFTTGVFAPVSLLFTNFGNIREFYISLGKIAFVLLTIGVFAAYFRHKPFLNRHWRKFHILNYVAFWLVFFHSFNLGSDTRTYPMNLVYPVTGILVLLSILKRLIPRRMYSWFRKWLPQLS